jgi:hypothetical protein|tara:strand:+ start:616 stop:936 length:321 start_codon:yes stop_codon:yes gene_type:complete
MSFTPAQLAAAICQILPDFEMSYAPDFRQEIAETWPKQLDDSAARRDWGWEPRFDLDAMTRDMLAKLEPVASLTVPPQLEEDILEAAQQRRRVMDFLKEHEKEVAT